MLTKDFLPWQSVYYQYRKWCQQEIWFLIYRALHQLSRVQASREAQASATAIDSQTSYELPSSVFFWWNTIQKLWADGGYGELDLWLRNRFQAELDIVENLKAKGFQVLPKRWIVERTFV